MTMYRNVWPPRLQIYNIYTINARAAVKLVVKHVVKLYGPCMGLHSANYHVTWFGFKRETAGLQWRFPCRQSALYIIHGTSYIIAYLTWKDVAQSWYRHPYRDWGCTYRRDDCTDPNFLDPIALLHSKNTYIRATHWENTEIYYKVEDYMSFYYACKHRYT